MKNEKKEVKTFLFTRWLHLYANIPHSKLQWTCERLVKMATTTTKKKYDLLLQIWVIVLLSHIYHQI